MAAGSLVIRVFVSSTFLDMKAERDELVLRTFPQLRAICESRGVTWGEVDLRWGITSEQQAEGRVLPICLEEINHCRPFFIGLLGERYGWIDRDYPPDLLSREPWLTEHVRHGKSITELEILHGVLNNPEMADRAYFYFRDPDYVDSLPSGTDRSQFLAEDDASRIKLTELKDRIRTAREQGHCQLHEPYRSPEELGQLVLDQFTRLIDELYPEDKAPEPLDREQLAHESTATDRSRVYVGRQEYYDRLDAHAAGDGPPLVIWGESGSGKSALLANWALRYRDRHPNHFVLMHFIGSTPASTDWKDMLSRIMAELKRRFDLEDDVPVQPDEIRDQFPDWLAKVAALGPIVLVLDALNQLEEAGDAHDLAWLPDAFPPTCRVIVSTLPGRCADALERRPWVRDVEPLTVRPLDKEERRAVAGAVLQQFSRSLESRLLNRLIAAPQTANPLFLRTLLDELRQIGVHERLEQQLAHYLEAANPKELFARVLARWEQNYGGERELVRDSLRLILGSRRGLSEAELFDLLGDGDEPLPRGLWAPFFAAAAASFVVRTGLVSFAHAYLREAVRERFVPDEAARSRVHLTLADYFAGQPKSSARTIDELPWQLMQAEEWQRLYTCLMDFNVVNALATPVPYQLLEYWLPLEPRFSMDQAFIDHIDAWCAMYADDTNRLRVRWVAGNFLHKAGRYEVAQSILQPAVELSNEAGGIAGTDAAGLALSLAGVFQALGSYAEAESLYRRALEQYDAELGANNLSSATARASLGSLLQEKGDFEAAEELYRAALDSYTKTQGPEQAGPVATSMLLGMLLYAKGDYAKAEPLLRSAVELRERINGPVHPATQEARSSLASLLIANGDLAGAEPLLQRAVEINERILGSEHIATIDSIFTLGTLQVWKADYTVAEPLLRRAMETQERILGPDNLRTINSVSTLAALLHAKGEYPAAEALYRRSVRDAGLALGSEHPTTLAAAYSLASVLQARGEYLEAEPLFRDTLAVQERVLGTDHPSTLQTLMMLAWTLQAKGEYAEAVPLFERSLEGHERLLGPEHPTTIGNLGGMAGAYFRLNDYARAEPLFRRVLDAYERVLGAEHPQTLGAMSNLALLLAEQRQYEEAEGLCRRALVAEKQRLGEDHPSTLVTSHNLAGLLRDKGDTDQAESIYRSILPTMERVLGSAQTDTLNAMSALAGILERKGETQEAVTLTRRCLAAREDSLGNLNSSTLSAASDLARLLETQGRLDEAESYYRQVMDDREQSLGFDHQTTLQSAMALSALLERKGDDRAALLLRGRVLAALKQSKTDDAEFAIELNSHALSLRKLGEFAAAADLLMHAVDIEDRTLPADHPKRAHRRNNLAVVCMLSGRLDDALRYNTDAWRLKCDSGDGEHDLTSARVLVVRSTLGWLRNERHGTFLGQLHTLLTGSDLPCYGDIDVVWDVRDIVDALRPRLTAEQLQLLETLVQVLNKEIELASLNDIEDWAGQTPVPLETPWPSVAG